MAMDIMRPTQTREMPVGGMKKEVEAGARYLKMTNPIDGMLGGSPDKIMSSTGSGVASSEEETRICETYSTIAASDMARTSPQQ